MKLISMTKFVFEQEHNVIKFDYNELHEFKTRISRYADFLKQPLTLGMFVPCDADGNVLEEVKCNKECESCDCMYEHDLYQEAKDKVLFEGFELSGNIESSWIFHLNGEFPRIIPKTANIDFLTMRYKGLVLTESAKKNLGL